MISFEVKSLFTNIPIDLIIKAVNEKWDEIKKHASISEKIVKCTKTMSRNYILTLNITVNFINKFSILPWEALYQQQSLIS